MKHPAPLPATLPIALALALAAALGGCATPYGDVSTASAGGYSDRRLGDDLYEIRFRGNVFTTRERVHDMALLRAAEVAQANNCASFRIVDRDNDTQVANTDAVNTDYKPDATGVFERTDVGSAPSYIHVMPTVETVTVLRIRCTAAVAGRQGAPAGLYDPATVERDIRARYDLASELG